MDIFTSALNLFLSALVGSLFVLLVWGILLGTVKLIQWTIIGLIWLMQRIAKGIQSVRYHFRSVHYL